MDRLRDRLPLSGIRVLEMGHNVMGPTCGLILADMGAEVVKIEPAPKGDDTRRLGGFGSGFFPFYNRNKKSIAIDLKVDQGKRVLSKLIVSADVFIENYGPQTVDRLGFGYNAVSKINPRIIYCSLKGFMPGPYEKRLALDEVVQMMGGLAYMTGPLGNPLRAGASVIDILGGTFGAVGILTALYEREKVGKGRFITASLFESTVFLMGQHMAYTALTGKPVPPMPHRERAWSVYELFETKDGVKVFIGITSDKQWKSFCEAFGALELYADERLLTNNGRIAQREYLIPELQKVFKRIEKSEIFRLCEEARIPFAPIVKPEELSEDPHLNEGGGLVEVTLTGKVRTKLPRIPLRIDSFDFGLRKNVPEIGEGGYELLKSSGISDGEIEEMKAKGVIVCQSKLL